MIFLQETFNLEKKVKKTQKQKYTKSKIKILELIKKKSFGFIQDLHQKDFSDIYQFSEKLQKFENVLFLGTGGSSLGGKTLVSLMDNIFINATRPRVFFVENIDSSSIHGLLQNIDLKNSACVVTSKSGETIETIAQFFFVLNEFKKKKISIKKRFFIITEDKESTLKEIQESENLDFYPHPIDIGGRYSVFSIVGLIPSKTIGFDIKRFCNGGKSFLKEIENENNFDYYFTPISNLIDLKKKGVNMSIVMPYHDLLNNLSFWYRQLWAESIGKKGKGITPVNALGTVDQHSQLQLYLDGPKDKFFTFIEKARDKSVRKLDCHYSKSKTFQDLHQKSLEELLNAEMNATIKTISNKKIPIRRITLESYNEKYIGSLMMFFFIETIFSCFLLEVNPFDQPAVEEGKKLTKRFLKYNE